MNTKKKKNRIILCLCSIFVLVASIFSFIPFAKDTHVVKADTVSSDYLFSGSNISTKTTFTKGLFSYNLFNFDNLVLSNYNDYPNSIDYINNTITVTRFYNASTVLLKDFANLEVGKSYVFTFDTTSSLKYIYLHGSSFQWISGRSHVITQSDLDDIVAFYGEQTSGVECLLTNFQFTESTSVLPYVPYQDSTQVNYEFDLVNPQVSANTGITQTSILDLYSNIYDSNGNYYKISSSEGEWSNSGAPDDAFRLLPFIPPSDGNSLISGQYLYPRRLTYSLYNSFTSTFDESYSFNLYYAFFYTNPSDTTKRAFYVDIDRVILGSYKDYDVYFNYPKNNFTSFDLSTSKYNFISYVNSYNFTFNIFIPIDSDVDSNYWNFRIYYLNSFSDAQSDAYYNSGYSNGYQDGFNKGNSQGLDQGYSNGYKTGKNDGYNLGYNQALENGEKYTFTALISSVIDVPVKAFTSLFNFEILGVNLSGFFLGLLTCCIVIGVIRLIL